MKPPYTEIERPSVWQSWYSLKTYKINFNVSSEYQGCRGGWGKAPMWGKGPTTEITFMDGNRGNICMHVFSYVIGPPVAAVADGENTP